MSMFFQKETEYKGKKVAKNFYETLPHDLTVTGLPYTSVYTNNKTLFKEVNKVPYKERPYITQLQQEINKQKPLTGDWVKDLFDQTMKTIERSWNPAKFHVVGHSSGWDTRIISYAIKKLAEKNGKEWLGKVLFVEVHGEGKPFKQIMQVEGWQPDQYLVYNEAADPAMYHKASIDFDTFWEKYNGLGSYPVSQWRDAFSVLVKKGVIPKDFQYFTGYGANEITENACKCSQMMNGYAKWHYYLQLDLFNTLGEPIFIFWDFDWIKKVFSYPDIKVQKIRINEIVSRAISPELNNIPRWDIPETSAAGYKHIGNSIMTEAIRNYNNSHYGKKHKCAPKNHLEYYEWWAHYCAASMCEHLIKEGYNVGI